MENPFLAWYGQRIVPRAKAMATVEAESAMYGIVEAKCGTRSLITAVARPEVGDLAAMMIEETSAEQEYPCTSAESGLEREPSSGLRSPVGLHVRDIESPPMTVQDVERSEYKEIWLSAMRAELEGHKTALSLVIDEILIDVNITAKWVFG